MKIKIIILAVFTVGAFILSSCKEDKPEPATLSTTEATEISANSAATGGNITLDGGADITSRGVCWDTTPNPTTAASKVQSGTGTGSFTVSITGLNAATTYYIRAFAINEAGTAYGNEISFTTLNPPPVPTISFNSNTLWIYPTDNSVDVKWADDQFIITGATSLIDGKANTTTIISVLGAGTYAAKICDDLEAFGHSDWYLPSRDELSAMEDNQTSIGNFDTEKGYWSSSEYADYYAFIVYFNNGMYVNTMKNNIHNVRCIRKQ
jgi:hypothetical protein